MLKINGPYRNNKGRWIVLIHDHEAGIRTSKSYPRYLMEQHLGRELTADEQVDHINGDPDDNRLENLQILTQLNNIRKYFSDNDLHQRYLIFNCGVCEEDFPIQERRYLSNQVHQHKRGPFCSKSCAGKATHLPHVMESEYIGVLNTPG